MCGVGRSYHCSSSPPPKMERRKQVMRFSRRDFVKATAGALPLARVLGREVAWGQAARTATPMPKPNSKWAGVQVGMNVPYNFGEGNNMPAEEVLRRCVDLNVSGVELRAQPIEMFMGAPYLKPNVPSGRGRAGGDALGRGVADLSVAG